MLETAVNHPATEELQRFMAGGLTPEGVRAVVRHLLRGCPICTRETRRLWSFGEERPRPVAARPALPAREVRAWQ